MQEMGIIGFVCDCEACVIYKAHAPSWTDGKENSLWGLLVVPKSAWEELKCSLLTSASGSSRGFEIVYNFLKCFQLNHTLILIT